MEDSSASSFQLKRREKRKQVLHFLLSDIRADYEGLQGGMQGWWNWQKGCTAWTGQWRWQAVQAAGVGGKGPGLDPPPAPECRRRW